jgi:hypothetical protein
MLLVLVYFCLVLHAYLNVASDNCPSCWRLAADFILSTVFTSIVQLSFSSILIIVLANVIKYQIYFLLVNIKYVNQVNFFKHALCLIL